MDFKFIFIFIFIFIGIISYEIHFYSSFYLILSFLSFFSLLALIVAKEIIFKLQEVIAEETPIITIYNTSGYTVYRPEKYDGWKHVFNHHEVTHNKISYLEME